MNNTIDAGKTILDELKNQRGFLNVYIKFLKFINIENWKKHSFNGI